MLDCGMIVIPLTSERTPILMEHLAGPPGKPGTEAMKKMMDVGDSKDMPTHLARFSTTR